MENLERSLRNIWARTLRNPNVSLHDNFFDLGGDSLLAVNLFLEIERETGTHLPITAIYDAPTAAEMARLLKDEQAPSASLLVPLKPGTGNPLFIVHGIGGTVMELAGLGRQIGIPGPVYAIQAKGLDGNAVPLASIEEMANLYVATIQSVQATGPYWLCGYSFGGLIAMEMARRLKAAGRPIGALILMDAYAHPSTWPPLSRLKMRVRRALHLCWRECRRSPADVFARLLRRLRDRGESSRLHEWLLDQNPSLPLPLLRVREAGGAALCSYRPAPYPGAVMFLKASERDIEFPDDPERIWHHLAPRAIFRTLAGGHRSIVTEHAAAAAAALTACLSSEGRNFSPHQFEDGSLAPFEVVQKTPLHTQAA